MGECKPIILNPNNENREFKCDICNKYLSISPILFNESVGNVCGRCFDNGETKKFDNDVVFQIQKVYENISRYIVFPCSYQMNGCGKELTWSEVKQHENACEFKDASCPLSCQEFITIDQNACEWKGTNQELVSHLSSSHDDYFSSISQVKILSSQENLNRIIFTEVMGTFTIIVMYYLKNYGRYYCNVLMDFPFNDCKTYQYDLEVFDESEKKCLVLPGNDVEPISGRNLTKRSIKNSLEIDLKSMSELLKKAVSMVLRFKIVRVYDDRIEPLDNEDKLKTNEEESMISDLTCSCGNFLYSPIYVCSNGHNCCDRCKSSFGYCKKCSKGFMSNNNSTLEAVTLLTKYPCVNKPKGCTYTIDFKQLAIHQENCGFTEKDCLMKCGWKGPNPEMFKHIRDKHSPLELHQEHIYDPQLKSKRYSILFDNKVFLLTIDYTIGYSLFIKLQCLGLDKWKYEFEFTILSSCNNINLVSSHLCQPLSYGVDKKEIETQKIEYPFKFFTQFITDYDQIKFKINISKILN